MIGVYLGRFQPFHNGHKMIMDTMIHNHGIHNSLLLIGSSHTLDENNIFTFEERRLMITSVYEDFKNIMFLPDICNDNSWLNQILLVLNLFRYDYKPEEVTFYCGIKHDIRHFKLNDITSKFKIVEFNRTDKDISGTEIRKAINEFNTPYLFDNLPYSVYKKITNIK